MKVLLSIKPEYVERIFDGSKKFEYRRAIFKKKDIDTVIVYATMPVGKIVGEFKIDHILVNHPDEIWDKTKNYSGVMESFYDSYFDGRDKAFAIKIASTKRYEQEICPYSQLDNFTAPQSFLYPRLDLLEKIENAS